jgi:hypothetical protein
MGEEVIERAYTTGDIRAAIQEYARQQNDVSQQLQQLEQQRLDLLKTWERLQGALIALDALLHVPAPQQEPGAPVGGEQSTADYPEGGC